jgi:di/tricarboxylate transporter
VLNTLLFPHFSHPQSRSANCLIYFVTLGLTEIVTNNAAAAIAIPIALSAAKSLAVSYKPFAMSVMIAASSGFAIPFGYACHLMVMGPGGYTLPHFVKIGLPLDIITWMLCSWLIPLIWPF